MACGAASILSIDRFGLHIATEPSRAKPGQAKPATALWLHKERSVHIFAPLHGPWSPATASQVYQYHIRVYWDTGHARPVDHTRLIYIVFTLSDATASSSVHLNQAVGIFSSAAARPRLVVSPFHLFRLFFLNNPFSSIFSFVPYSSSYHFLVFLLLLLLFSFIFLFFCPFLQTKGYNRRIALEEHYIHPCARLCLFLKVLFGGILHDGNGTYGHRETGEASLLPHRRFFF